MAVKHLDSTAPPFLHRQTSFTVLVRKYMQYMQLLAPHLGVFFLLLVIYLAFPTFCAYSIRDSFLYDLPGFIALSLAGGKLSSI
jgi:hypothetical protein